MFLFFIHHFKLKIKLYLVPFSVAPIIARIWVLSIESVIPIGKLAPSILRCLISLLDIEDISEGEAFLPINLELKADKVLVLIPRIKT
jgi:hypothetical protein